ncbi:MAG TPA: hypothetical protein PKZ76_10365 [Xanthomonadaceae bacterium]|nr:hypothetical protein [Xanthomonadaceae bacterium]
MQHDKFGMPALATGNAFGGRQRKRRWMASLVALVLFLPSMQTHAQMALSIHEFTILPEAPIAGQPIQARVVRDEYYFPLAHHVEFDGDRVELLLVMQPQFVGVPTGRLYTNTYPIGPLPPGVYRFQLVGLVSLSGIPSDGEPELLREQVVEVLGGPTLPDPVSIPAGNTIGWIVLAGLLVLGAGLGAMPGRSGR